MKKQTKITGIIIAITILLVIGLLIAIGMQKNTKVTYASPCTTAQETLDGSVRTQDLRTRVDRLHSYVFIHQQLDLFVQRLERNNQPNADTLREYTNELESGLTAFRENYEEYDIARDQVVQITECSDKAAEFQQKLQEARIRRQLVAEDVAAIDKLLDSKIKPQLGVLYGDLLASGTSEVPSE